MSNVTMYKSTNGTTYLGMSADSQKTKEAKAEVKVQAEPQAKTPVKNDVPEEKSFFASLWDGTIVNELVDDVKVSLFGEGSEDKSISELLDSIW
jgi:hypothetical protein